MDGGAELLPCMEYFVTLVRKTKTPALLLTLAERAGGAALGELTELVHAATGTLAFSARKAFFHAVAGLDVRAQQRIEQAAERIVLLDDEYGAQAVQSLLDDRAVGDATILAMPTNRYSRALHLYLRQEFPAAGALREQRFDHAERLQAMHRQWQCEHYSSHYLGPKGIVPKMGPEVEALLRHRIAALFPQVAPDQILIEQFTRRDLAHAARYQGKNANEATPVLLYTLTATFNGATTHFRQVAHGEVIDYEEPAAISVSFSWEPATGALGVFCEDREVRQDLAMMFRDVVLACDGGNNDMTMRHFNLFGFSTPAMLKRMEQALTDGVEHISILQIKVTRPFEQRILEEANDRNVVQHLSSSLTISRDRRDPRHIYQVAYEDYGMDDLTGYMVSQVKLVFRMARQTHRKAHHITVQISAPNELNDKSKTEEDRRRVLDQLVRLGVLCEF